MLKGAAKFSMAHGAGIAAKGESKGGLMGGAMKGIGKAMEGIGPTSWHSLQDSPHAWSSGWCCNGFGQVVP